MGTKPDFKHSKEFQIKLRKDVSASDCDSIGVVQKVLSELVSDNALELDLDSTRKWLRRGERYDTCGNLFRAHNISLATEKSERDGKQRTKLKCKLHSFVPELLYKRRKSAHCYPSPSNSGVKTKFKKEQDIHFDNCKYCATGYLTLSGTGDEFNRVGDFIEYYPNLAKIPGVQPSDRLERVKNWDESVFDNIKMEINGWKLKGALVTRREHRSGEWVESEFSFKAKEPKKGWKRKDLRAFAAGYTRLLREYAHADGLFIRAPSIFFFDNPVSSRDIELL